MKVHVITLFPEFYDSPFSVGRLRKAIGIGALIVNRVSPRSFAKDRYGTVDDTPYGGGAGMILKPEPIFEAVDSASDSTWLTILQTPSCDMPAMPSMTLSANSSRRSVLNSENGTSRNTQRDHHQLLHAG